ncbi:MAG: lysophospholipid acyltransferase family protein [Thermoanaerobaculales bacterium]|jgi:KDO2-lipid IV(A) lauroyltransferase|nr:lysophospholipid acyltransferase family protein [Thermoanaerobaculales bacterium]
MAHPVRDGLLYHGVMAVLGGLGRAPLGLGRRVGRVVSRALLRTLPRERRRVERHLAIAFPELSAVDRRRIVRGCADHFGSMLAEVAWLLRAAPHEVTRLVDIEGFEHLMDPIRRGRGVVLGTGHAGNWELCNAALCAYGLPLTIAVRELHEARLDRLITTLRGRFGTEVISRGAAAGRRLLEGLHRGRCVGLLIDQDIPSIPGVFVPFFGRPAWTPSGAAMIALRTGSPLVPGFIHRRPDGTHLVKIGAPLAAATEGSLEDRVWELTAAVTAAVEWQVRSWPEQWVWMHRRWRTRPEDTSSETFVSKR